MPAPDAAMPVLPDRIDRILSALEAMDLFILEFDSDGRTVYASPNIEGFIGFTPAECLASDCIDFHPDDLAGVIAVSQKVRATGEPTRNSGRLRHKRGHWVWSDSYVVGWHPSEEADFHTIVVNRDITDLKNAEAARRESETRYQLVSQMSCDLLLEMDHEGRLSYVGPGSDELSGYTSEEVLAAEPWSLIHPNDRELLRADLERQFGEPEEGLGSHDRQLLEYRVAHRDGHWLDFEGLGVTYSRADGEKRYLVVCRNVTERKLAERQRRELEETMQRAQKLESLGVMAGGIAHDFNNLLTPILGAATLGLGELPKNSPVRARLETIQRAAKRAAALTSQMLSYAGQRPPRVERMDLSALVVEMRELLASSVSGKTHFDLELESDLPAVDVEPAQLGQVVMNLVSNASESLQEGAGRIVARTGVVDLESPPAGALFAEAMAGGRHVYFEVEDEGSGMDEETRKRIFEPFYTTKFSGRGLGLAAVTGIVRAHRGAIEVESEPGRGTRVRVLLPVAAGSAAGPPPEQVSIDDWRATGAVLVIDDDEAVRDLYEELLRRSGLTVLTASDGYEGVKLFGAHADSIRVVLLDRSMPALSGVDAFDAIRALRRDAKIVLVSGHSEELVTEELASRGLSGFLEKPFTPEALLTRVREVLEG
jgi:PAS domain S-box-containing protein